MTQPPPSLSLVIFASRLPSVVGERADGPIERLPVVMAAAAAE